MSINREMTVAIAQDVIKQVNALHPVKGYYLSGNARSDVKLEDDLQKHADSATQSCSVCALGALILSKARLYNDVQVARLCAQVYGSSRLRFGGASTYIQENLSPIFTKEQLDLIEHAFECWPSDTEEEARAGSFGLVYDDPRDRLKAIMQNIVDNGGEFKP